VQRLHVDGRLCRSVAAAGTENISSPALELRFPRRVDVELLRKLNSARSPLMAASATFVLKPVRGSGAVVCSYLSSDSLSVVTLGVASTNTSGRVNTSSNSRSKRGQ
jgi:hypothetical protein